MRLVAALAMVVALALGAADAAAIAFDPLPTSCEASGRNGSCEFRCDLGDKVYVVAIGPSTALVRASVECGGAAVECAGAGGCSSSTPQTSRPSIGTCSATAESATVSCGTLLNTIGFSETDGASCTTSGEDSCYYVCARGHVLFASAVAPFSWAPASAATSCGGASVICAGVGTCLRLSDGTTTDQIGLGVCRAYSGSTSVTCGMSL